MKQVLEFLRICFVSFEFLAILAIIFLLRLTPNWFEYVGLTLRSNSEVLKWFPGFPIGCLVSSIALSWSTLFPDAEFSKIICKWPHFWMIKWRTYVTLILLLSASGTSVIVWIFEKSLSNANLAALIIGSASVALISCASMLHAALTLRQICEESRD